MLILCCGNRDRGDDGAGILVAEALNALGVPAQACTGEGTVLMQAWEGAREVLVVDAVVTGAPPGAILHWDATESTIPFRPSDSTHGFGVAAAIELSRALGRLPKELRLYGIEAGRFEVGTEPSFEVRQAVESVVQEIAREFRNPTY